MNRQGWVVLVLVVLVAVLTREFFPKRIEGPVPVPRIVTVRDTIRDTLRLERVVHVPKPGKATTDTLQLVIRETIYDTTYINVSADSAARTDAWPVIAVTVGKKVGDTTTVATFSLRTGQGAVSRIYTPGPLLGVWANHSATPRLEFGPPPPPYRVRFWDKVKWSLIGAGTYMVVSGVTGLVR